MRASWMKDVQFVFRLAQRVHFTRQLADAIELYIDGSWGVDYFALMRGLSRPLAIASTTHKLL